MARYQLPKQSEQNLIKFRGAAISARRRYAQAKSDLKHGTRTIESVLNDEGLQRMRVLDAIASMPHIGRPTARSLMCDLGISMGRRVQGLGCRQRVALIEKLG